MSVLHVNIYVWGRGLVQIQGYKLIVLCSWVGRFTHTVASSTQEYINLVLTNCWATRHIACGGRGAGGVTCNGLTYHPGGVAIIYTAGHIMIQKQG